MSKTSPYIYQSNLSGVADDEPVRAFDEHPVHEGVKHSTDLPIATKVSPFARRLQRSIAFGVVFIPFVGFIVAMLLGWKYGFGYIEVGLFVGMYIFTIGGVTVGYHRHFAHRAFKTSSRMRVILAIIGSMTAQGPIVFWVAVHRRHHVYSDQPEDPHSPNLHGSGLKGTLRGLWHGHIGWMFSDEQTSWIKFARDILQDRALFRIHQQYFLWLGVGLAIPTVLGGLLYGSLTGAFYGFLWGGLVRIFCVNQAMWCVGSICHYFGNRPYQTYDYSGNIWWVAFISFGEGLQNNHHAFPNSARHGLAWWQPDFSGLIITALEAIGLIWDVRHPSERAMLAARRTT
ncbi:MAG TPA: fatty acid desaturase [Pyrinomonadaceae bacterium]|jgi:stearoyl-CoA desaturase (delta-9 desaturase)